MMARRSRELATEEPGYSHLPCGRVGSGRAQHSDSSTQRAGSGAVSLITVALDAARPVLRGVCHAAVLANPLLGPWRRTATALPFDLNQPFVSELTKQRGRRGAGLGAECSESRHHSDGEHDADRHALPQFVRSGHDAPQSVTSYPLLGYFALSNRAQNPRNGYSKVLRNASGFGII